MDEEAVEGPSLPFELFLPRNPSSRPVLEPSLDPKSLSSDGLLPSDRLRSIDVEGAPADELSDETDRFDLT